MTNHKAEEISLTGTHATRSAALKSIVKSHRGLILGLVVTSFISAGFEALLLVIMTAMAVALVSGANDIGPYFGITMQAHSAIIAAALLLLLRIGLGLGSVLISTKLVAQVTIRQRHKLADAYLNASWDVQSMEPPGRLQELLTSFVSRVTLTIQAYTSALTSLLSLAAFLATSLLLDLLSTAMAAGVIILIGTVLVPFRGIIRNLSSKWSKADIAFAGSVAELGALGREMQIFGVRDQFIETIDSLSITAATNQRRAQALNSFQSQLYMALAYAAVLAGIGVSNSFGIRNVTVMGAILLLMLRSLSYGQSLASARASIAAYSPFVDKVQSLTAEYERTPAPSGKLRYKDPLPLVVENASYAYSPQNLALKNISFEIQSGEIIGVVGPSGSGKSTLAQLLLGLREPTSGSIEVGGVKLAKTDPNWWHCRTSFVPQEALLISGTIEENIRFFRHWIDHSQIIQAAALANILNDIQSLPQTLQTHIGPHGSQLSGGQRQRLSIARALAGRPSFIVMDEPTSALDGESERLVRDSLAKLRGEVTVLLIAHRMTTIEICDRVLVIEDGELTGNGTSYELQRTNTFYRRTTNTPNSDM